MRPGRARHADPGRRARSDGDDEAPIEGVVISPDAYSQGEVLRHREFDRMTPGRAARGRAPGRPARAAPRAPADAPLRAPFARPPARAAGDVPAQPGDRRPARLVGLAAADPRAALARRPVRHLGLDGAPFAAAAALRPGALGRLGGPDRIVRVRDAADPGHAAAARPRPRPGARARRRFGQRLGRRDADRRVVPDLQPELGAAHAADVGRSSSSSPTAGTVATRRSSRPRPPGSGATATGWSGSTRWPARPATSRWPAGCVRPTRTSTTSCRPGRSPRSSASARSWAASGRATRGAAARRPPTRRCPGPSSRGRRATLRRRW